MHMRHRIALAALMLGTVLLGLLVGRCAFAAPLVCDVAVGAWGSRIYHDRDGAPTFTRPLALATCSAVVAEAIDAEVDPVLAVAMAAHESHFNPFAFRSTGERGVLQAKPYHCREQLGHRCADVDDHLRAGVRLLAALVERGGRRLGIEAYHCGWRGATREHGWLPCRQYRDRIEARVRVLDTALDHVRAPGAGATTEVSACAEPRGAGSTGAP